MDQKNNDELLDKAQALLDNGDQESYFKINHQLASSGDARGVFNVANCFFHGIYVAKDLQKAYSLFQLLAEAEIPDAIYYLGLYAQEGYLEEPDFAKAMEYYKKASDMGDAWSAVQLGMMYSLGQGTETDYEKGFEYYKLGYERGDVLACANLGWCFETGQGTEKDLDKALRYYWEGASRGEEHCVEAVKRLSDPAAGAKAH